MFPEICKDVGFNKGEIILEDEIIKFLIDIRDKLIHFGTLNLF